MAKDPAFLFYSQAFYESTRMMLPEERACYLDLLIYQHQNGLIPLDTSRLHLYCTGVSQPVVNQVLNQKFNQTVNGWLNKKMESVVEERKIGNPKKRAYAILAGLLSANSPTDSQRAFVKKNFNVNDFVNFELKEMKESIKKWYYALVNDFVNNNKDINKDKDINKTFFNKKDFKNKLLELGADENYINDWIEVRVSKKAVFTKTALNKFVKECDAHNFPVSEAVKTCAEQSWSGFNYAWIKNINGNFNNKQKTTTDDDNR